MSNSYGRLTSALDNIIRFTSIPVKGCETEFLKFVKFEDDCRQRWLAAEMKVVELQQKISKLQAERDTYEVTLKHARNQLDVEMKKRQKSEVNKDALDRQLALVRELLGDGNRMSLLNDEERQSLAFLSATNLNTHTPKRLSTVDESADLLSASDVSYDHTEEDLDDTDVSFLRDGRPWHRSSPPKTKKRPSAPPIEYDDQQLKNKKVKRTSKVTTTEADTSIVTRTTVSVPHSGPITATTHIETVRSPPRQRLLSRDSIDSDDYAWSECRPVSTTDLRNTPGTPIGRGRRAHSFCSKTIIKPESCNPCQKRIGFGKIALKCTDCRAVCHPDCKELVPLPCVPTMKTPGTGPKKHGPMSLEQYTPNTSPMVPALVIHCCTEVESRGLSEQGIYRVSGAGGQVKELKEKMLKGKGNPNLYRVNDIHVVCGVLKDFLRSLSEPIVTYKLHADFVKAGQYCDDSDAQTAIYQAVSELPQSNRDTLAYIILHLQRVSESKVCKMPATNLAKVFGPTLIGHDNPEPTPMQMLEDAKKQAKVMEHLLAMPQDFWNAFIDVDTENGIIYNHNTHCTPESKPTPSSMLGPLTTPGNGMTPYRTASASSVASTAGSVSKKISVFSKTPMTPRFGSTKSKNSARPRHFFSSPKLI